MSRHLRAGLAAAVSLTLATAGPALAGNPFSGATSTEAGYHTYDSDQINVEGSSFTGQGVYVAVLDTGLAPNWSDYFPAARIATSLGIGFYQHVSFQPSEDPCEFDGFARGPITTTTYIGSRGSTHGTHVTSTIIGYAYQSKFDALEGYPLPPIQVRGIAPGVTVIPVKVLADYQLPTLPHCDDPNALQGTNAVFGTQEMVAAGIDYITGLKTSGSLGGAPVVINMSLGGPALGPVEQAAIDNAVAAGVIVVAAAGNAGIAGMSFPGAYGPVISAGAAGWTGEWLDADGTMPDNSVRYRVWWLKNVRGTTPIAGDLGAILQANSGDVVEGAAVANQTYVAEFSSRELAGQDLDVVAPGSWVRGPFPGTHGYNHLPWWSRGLGDLLGTSGNFFFVGGTSMATPHVASVAALMLDKNASLTQAQIELILESTAVDLGAGSASVWDPFATAGPGSVTVTWGADASGEGLVQADLALTAVP